MRHHDLLNWQRSSTVKSLSLKWEFFLLKEKKNNNDDDEITFGDHKKRKNTGFISFHTYFTSQEGKNIRDIINMENIKHKWRNTPLFLNSRELL